MAISAIGLNFSERIDGPEIAGLGHVDRRRLTAVQLPGRDRCHGFRQPRGIDPAMCPRDRRELETAAEKPGGVRLRGVDVRRFAAIDDAPGRADRRQAQRVGGSSGRHRKDPDRRLEQIGEAPLQRRRPLVRAIAERGIVIGADQRFEDFAGPPARYCRCGNRSSPYHPSARIRLASRHDRSARREGQCCGAVARLRRE